MTKWRKQVTFSTTRCSACFWSTSVPRPTSCCLAVFSYPKVTCAAVASICDRWSTKTCNRSFPIVTISSQKTGNVSWFFYFQFLGFLIQFRFSKLFWFSIRFTFRFSIPFYIRFKIQFIIPIFEVTFVCKNNRLIWINLINCAISNITTCSGEINLQFSGMQNGLIPLRFSISQFLQVHFHASAISDVTGVGMHTHSTL